jgi:hypothetical protein
MASILPTQSCPTQVCDDAVITQIPGPPGPKGDAGDTPVVTLASITPQTTAGDIIGFTTLPVRVAVGTEGQIIVARLANANKLAWESLATALGLTTKGDILVRTAAGLVRLPVGADGQVLTADSGEVPGIAWAAPVSSDTMPTVRVVTSTPDTFTSADTVIFTNLGVAGPVALFLPNSANYKKFVIKDIKGVTGDAGTNNITITPFGGQTIEGSANLVMNINAATVVLRYYQPQADWKIINV